MIFSLQRILRERRALAYPIGSTGSRVYSLPSWVLLLIAQWLSWKSKNQYSRSSSLSSNSLPIQLVAIELIKIVISLALYYLPGPWQAGPAANDESVIYAHPEDYEYPLDNFTTPHEQLEPDGSGGRSGSVGTSFRGAMTSFALLAMLYLTKSYLVFGSYFLTDEGLRYIHTLPATVFSAILSTLFLRKIFSSTQWLLMLLQTCGLIIAEERYVPMDFPESFTFILLALTLYSAALSVYNAHLFAVYTNFNHLGLNIILFSMGLIFHASSGLFLSWIVPYGEGFTWSGLADCSWSLLLHAIVDILTIHVIYSYGAIFPALVALLSSASISLYCNIFQSQKSFFGFIGSSVALLCGILYVVDFLKDQVALNSATHQPISKYFRLCAILGIASAAAASIYGLTTVAVEMATHKTGWTGILPIWGDFNYLPPAHHSVCRRKLLPISTAFSTEEYNEFKDVLLIVFFSHPRYDINLDSYRAAYGPYFPNMVFVGPASREDKGFKHSYDVVVDSYQSEEDLSDPSFYKMAGRMAHHMLHTVMRDYDCYEGYLWAPFDTLLNVPRLQQFQKDRFWYHSPFGEFVPNPAMGLDWNNRTMHPPALNISPDPAGNYSKTYRGWSTDWWWGEPHVGLNVCIPAFERAPLFMRERLAKLTNGARLLGGSADTLYIPQRYRSDFLHILSLFLETDCFLEIAVPTTVHLVVQPDDVIQYVDHWWIWRPPFNVSFVHRIWDEGMEVDTFHTFHWGDTDKDGVWMAHPHSIEQVQQLLLDSARRQGVSFPGLLGSAHGPSKW